jgi:hypothetical protein
MAHLSPQAMHKAPDTKPRTRRRPYRSREAIDAAGEDSK